MIRAVRCNLGIPGTVAAWLCLGLLVVSAPLVSAGAASPQSAPAGPPTADWQAAIGGVKDELLAAAPVATAAAIAADRSAGTRLFRWDRNPEVFVLVFADSALQNQALSRVAAFVELDAAPRDRVLSDAQLERVAGVESGGTAEFFVGHDYPLAVLVQFFNRARSEAVRLNGAEEGLAMLLQHLGLVTRGGDGALEPLPSGAVLVSLVQSPPSSLDSGEGAARKWAVLRHELSHAEFFTNTAYRQYCLAFWHDLDDAVRATARRELVVQGYDAGNDLLLANELQAQLWDAGLSVFLDLQLRARGSSVAALRGRFLAGLDQGNLAVTNFFQDPTLRAVVDSSRRTRLEKRTLPERTEAAGEGTG